MKKRMITILLTLALLMTLTPAAAFAGAGLLESREVYHTEDSDYMDGDCVLTSTRMMIRRAAIMNGTRDWESITNGSLRPSATVDGLLLFNFSYEAGGMTYTVSTGTFDGEGDAARIREFSAMLRLHPEGVVVHGDYASETGPHGVLVTSVENGEVYAMDPAYNTGDSNEGIQKWEATTMLEPGLCENYWYISSMEAASGDAQWSGFVRTGNSLFADNRLLRLSARLD